LEGRRLNTYEIAKKELPDGKELTVIPLTYGRARLHVGERGSMFFDDGW
jgi:hypothetical protein